MKIMLSAGEASGDLHGGNLAKMLKELCPTAELFGMGGSQMEKAGVEILRGIDDLGVMGLGGSIKLIRKLFQIRTLLLEEAERRKPDVLVVIDYPEFNTRLARSAHKRGIPVVFYISPSAWAWRKGRAKDVAAISRRVAAIFPFEAEVYREAGASVVEVGHPLVDIVKATRSREEARRYFGISEGKKAILLMPGSRKQELEKLLPPMLDTVELLQSKRSDLEFFLPLASTVGDDWIKPWCESRNLEIHLVRDFTYDLMSICEAGIITSGTACLEAALMKVPSVIIYKASSLTYVLGKKLVKIPYFGLPNIVAGRQVQPELIQEQVQPAKIAQFIELWLDDRLAREQVLKDLEEVREKLGGSGAIRRTAEAIITVANENKPEGANS